MPAANPQAGQAARRRPSVAISSPISSCTRASARGRSSWVSRQHSRDQVGQAGRQGVGVILHIRRRRFAMAAQRLLDRPGRVRKPARQHLEQCHAQAVNVAAHIVARRGAAQFRRQIIGGAQEVAAVQERGVLAGVMGEAEIDEDGPAMRGQANVVGLDVAVDEILAVQRRQRLGGLAGDPQGGRRVEGVIAAQPAAQRLPGSSSMTMKHGGLVT